MSLDVPVGLLERAADGEVDAAAFVDCVRGSLPYAWEVIGSVAAALTAADAGVEFADQEVPPPAEHERGQLLRALASDAIRGGLERHFGVRLAFQNCHRVAAFRPAAVHGATYRRTVTADRGCAEAAAENDLLDLAVRTVVIPARPNPARPTRLTNTDERSARP